MDKLYTGWPHPPATSRRGIDLGLVGATQGISGRQANVTPGRPVVGEGYTGGKKGLAWVRTGCDGGDGASRGMGNCDVMSGDWLALPGPGECDTQAKKGKD
jgi:hypothetical protein